MFVDVRSLYKGSSNNRVRKRSANYTHLLYVINFIGILESLDKL